MISQIAKAAKLWAESLLVKANNFGKNSSWVVKEVVSNLTTCEGERTGETIQFVPLPLRLQRLLPCRPQSAVALIKFIFSKTFLPHRTTNNSRMTFRAPFTKQHPEAIFPWYTWDRLKCVYRADTALARAHTESVSQARHFILPWNTSFCNVGMNGFL